MAQTSKIISLICKDDEKTTIPLEQANRLGTIKNVLDDIDDGEEGDIPIQHVSIRNLDIIKDFMVLHPCEQDSINLTEEGKMNLRVSSMDKEDVEFFRKLSLEEMFNLILDVNFLDYKLMLDYCCKYIADIIKGKTPDEIKKIFSIEGEFTEEEKSQITKDNPWLVTDETEVKTEGGGSATA